jgi:hypothetical protein
VGPVETLFVTIQLLIATIGVVRGYQKELGNTLVFMTAIFFLSYVGGIANPRISSFAENTFGFVTGSAEMNAFLFFLYVGVWLSVHECRHNTLYINGAVHDHLSAPDHCHQPGGLDDPGGAVDFVARARLEASKVL